MSLRFCLFQEDVLDGFWRSLQCSIHSPPVRPVCVTTSPQLNTAWAKPCFPFLRCWMVCQNFHGKTVIPSPWPLQILLTTESLLQQQTKTVALLASWCLFAVSGDPLAWKSSFSLKASFTTGVHQGVLLGFFGSLHYECPEHEPFKFPSPQHPPRFTQTNSSGSGT